MDRPNRHKSPSVEEVSGLRAVIRDEATKVVVQHLSLCPFSTAEVESRLRRLEIKLATLIGAILGSGLLGGVSGAVLSKLIN